MKPTSDDICAEFFNLHIKYGNLPSSNEQYWYMYIYKFTNWIKHIFVRIIIHGILT